MVIGDYFDVSTTASFDTVVMSFTPTVGSVGTDTRLLQFELGIWNDVTDSVNMPANTITSARLASNSPFAIVSPHPTTLVPEFPFGAASVSLVVVAGVLLLAVMRKRMLSGNKIPQRCECMRCPLRMSMSP